MSQSNSFPLFFTLERVDNGYILSSKEETGSLTQEATFRKEVVAEDKIHSRIGQLLHPDALVKEHPVVFRVEAVSENTYKSEEGVQVESLMEAKLAFAHFKSKNIPPGTVLALLVEDTKSIEFYGLEAEKIAEMNNLKVIRSQKHLASLCTNMTVMNTSHEKILQWYSEHQVETEVSSKK